MGMMKHWLVRADLWGGHWSCVEGLILLDMNNEEAGVWGGAQKDFSLGMNYYMNKHIGMKLAYSWVMPGKHIKEISDKNFSVLQLRFQMIL